MHRDNFKLNHMPLYLQIKEKLAQDIRDKKYKYGEKLPSELELAAMFGVSRSTLREAVRALAQEGLVSIRRGLGTFVTGTRLDIISNIAELHSITKIIQQHGWTPGTTKPLMREEDPDKELIERLQLMPNDKILHVERVRTADGKPVFYSIQKVGKPELVEKLLNWDMDGSINEFFQRECGVEITHTVTEILPIQSSKDIAGKMGVPEEVPILLMDQIQYERNNAPVCRSYDYYRTDVFRFNLIRKREGVLV
jgi:GntR family transcriptional regulator